MSFQFKCPGGHLLEGDPAHAGQQCHCPTCGMLFIIPEPLPRNPAPAEPGVAYPPASQPAVSQPPESQPQNFEPPGADTGRFPPWANESQTSEPAFFIPSAPASSDWNPPPADAGSPAGGAAFAPQYPSADSGQPAVAEQPAPSPTSAPPALSEPELLHIPCPNGHELETPREMLNQDVLCPYCQAQFRLREKDSVEHKRRRAEEIERRERRISKAWFHWAIITAVLVLCGLLLLIFSSSG